MVAILAPLFVAAACIAYVFWTQSKLTPPAKHSRLNYIQERKAVVYENLRDLNFEYRAGKYPAADYEEQRTALENEASTLIAEATRIESAPVNSSMTAR
ncbi:MAG: hypothetical protein PW792_07525 [Acidobacteriaceae bacterium]|nr:hypothetical protein [Acidobacteriaceae bacterium]